jgi:aspartyl/glutamyl-tRNA(Asn/Gln) amidotransferase C subunit
MTFFSPFFLELDLIVPSLVEIKMHEEIANCDLHGCCIHALSLREKQYEGFELVCH